MLDRITITAPKTRRTRSGVAWSALVCLDGNFIAFVENDGNGGCCTFIPYGSTTHRTMRAFISDANHAANEAIGGRPSSEAFENLLACMKMGTTALQAVPIWKAALAA